MAQKVAQPRSGNEFVIIAALDEEYAAVRRAMDGGFSNISDPYFKSYDGYILLSDNKWVRGSIYQPNDTGRVEAAVLASHLLSERNYKLILLVGVAGGFHHRSKNRSNRNIALGDVVFASSIVDTEFQKVTDLGPEYRDRVINVEAGLVHQFERYAYETKSKFSSGSRAFEIHVGPVVSANKVIASQRMQLDISERVASSSNSGYPLAIEMEAVGVAVAARRLSHGSKFGMLRGISDYADEHKNDDEALWRREACRNAATTALGFVRFFAGHNNWLPS